MKIISEVTEKEVWKHWQYVEHTTNPYFRGDIRIGLPINLTWYLAEIEAKDCDNMFIISSGDWTDISAGTFRVVDVVNGLNTGSINPDTQRISIKIAKIINDIVNGVSHDTKLIVVTNMPELNGLLTIIDGNHRSVAFTKLNTIVGCKIYIGTSPDIIKSQWATQTYK